MIISHRHRFIFIHLHKTAGDAICDVLKPQLGKTDFLLQSDFQAWVQGLRTKLPEADLGLRKHSPALHVRERLPPHVWDSYYKFAFVRHPFERVTSLYHFAAKHAADRQRLTPRNAWYLTPPGRRSDPLNWSSVRACRATDSFSSFIRHPAARQDLAMHPQLHSLVDRDGSLIVDFVGRYERLEEDFLEVQRRVGLRERPLRTKNASKNSNSRLVLSQDDRFYLTELFHEDLRYFGYPVLADTV